MSNKTSNYGLTKPLPEEFYDVDVQNQNMDIIDEALVNKKHPMSMGGHKITDVAEPEHGSDVATRHFVEQHSIAGNTYVAVDYNNDGNVTLKPYVADEDELVFRGHMNDQNNPHNVTAEQVGAFPTVKIMTSPFDFNDCTENGFFYFSAAINATNAPTGVVNGWCHIMKSDGGAVKQVLYRAGTADATDFCTYVRSYVGNAWSQWKRYAVVEVKAVNGTTNELGNYSIGINIECVPIAVTAYNTNNFESYICTPFAEIGKWYAHITATDGTTAKPNTDVTINCYYLAL